MQNSSSLFSCWQSYFLNWVGPTEKKNLSVQIISTNTLPLTWPFPSSNTLSKTYTFILMPHKIFMGTHFYNIFPEDGKTLKAKLFIKMLCEKHVSFRPEHSQMLSLLIALLTTKVNSSKGYLPAKFKSNNHILVAILGIQIPRQLWKSYPQSTFNIQYRHLQIQPWSTFSRRPSSLMLLKC